MQGLAFSPLVRKRMVRPVLFLSGSWLRQYISCLTVPLFRLGRSLRVEMFIVLIRQLLGMVAMATRLVLGRVVFVGVASIV